MAVRCSLKRLLLQLSAASRRLSTAGEASTNLHRPSTGACCGSCKTRLSSSTSSEAPASSPSLLVLLDRTTNRRQRNCRRYYLLYAGLLGFIWKEEEDSEDEVPLSVKRLLHRAQWCTGDLDYRGAEQCYHDALAALASSKHSKARTHTEARAVVLDKLANLYLSWGRMEEAEANLKETMKALVQHGVDQEDSMMVELSLKLAKVYSNLHRNDLAVTGFEWCVDASRRKCDAEKTENNLATLGMCLHAKGQHHLSVGDYQVACLAMQEALDIAKQTFGEQHLQVAVVGNDLATAMDAAGRFAEAEKLVQGSISTALLLQLSSSTTGADRDPETRERTREYLAMFYYNLAMIASHKGDHSAAFDAFEKAVVVAKELLDNSLLKMIQDSFQKIKNQRQ